MINKSLLITTAGFEKRCLAYAQTLTNKDYTDIVIIDYEPKREESKVEELIDILGRISAKITHMKYDRFQPEKFEHSLPEYDFNQFGSIVIDISVMSKLLIIQLLYFLADFCGELQIVYTEPISWAPSEERFNEYQKEYINVEMFPSYGVHDVLRTPMLSSTVMYQSPVLLIAFLSFNEQLIRSLINNVNLNELILINKKSKFESWRELALISLHKNLINQFKDTNPFEENGTLIRCTEITDYEETFKLLSDVYNIYCYSHRIILGPTGSKMQSVGCALFKICCPDVHIEYPTPESYYVKEYSSAEIRQIHKIKFGNYKKNILELKNKYNLNI